MEQRAEAGIGLSDGVVADSEVAYRRIVEQSPLVVYTHDGSRPPAMTYVSPQVERMLGVPPSPRVSPSRSRSRRLARSQR